MSEKIVVDHIPILYFDEQKIYEFESEVEQGKHEYVNVFFPDPSETVKRTDLGPMIADEIRKIVPTLFDKSKDGSYTTLDNEKCNGQGWYVDLESWNGGKNWKMYSHECDKSDCVFRGKTIGIPSQDFLKIIEKVKVNYSKV